MNKLSYGNFDSDNDDIAFIASNGYDTPASEIAVRKQLSYPLKEVKDFINNTVSEDSSRNAIQMVVDNGRVKYRTEANGVLTTAVVRILSGTTDPSSDLGEDGDIYIKYE